MTDEHDEWLTADAAAGILRVAARPVHRYGESGKLRTQRTGRRLLFNRLDVDKLADELRVDLRPDAPRQRSEVMPASELLSYLRERERIGDERQAELQRQIGALMMELGAQRQRADELAHKADELVRKADELRTEIAQRSEALTVARRP